MGLGKGVVGCNSRGTFEIRIRPTVMNPSNKVKILHYRSWANSQPIDDPEPAESEILMRVVPKAIEPYRSMPSVTVRKENRSRGRWDR